MVLSLYSVSTVTASLGAARARVCHGAGCVCYSRFQTHSWCGAPVFVSRVRTKNMKMTKTARPTQNPITMESGGKKERENKMINILLTLAKSCLPHAALSANPKQFAACFWVTKRKDNQICLFLNRRLPLKILFWDRILLVSRQTRQ